MSNAATAESDSTDSDQSSDNQNDQGRQVAKRVFASELTAATTTVQFSKNENAPKFQLLPSGDVANRVAIAGVLTNVSEVNDSMLNARVCDPTGAIECYAGQYQPDAQASLEELDAPEHVMVVGKPSEFEPEEVKTLISVPVESITAISQEEKERWVAETAERTNNRITALEQGEAAHGDLASDQYPNFSVDTLREYLLDAGDDLGIEATPP